ncbi:MAG: electron transport complex protein RnfB [Pseudohongiellaceae bacterium]|jgi:electron transport complex protein RnfB
MLPVISHWLTQLVIGSSLLLITAFALLKLNRYLRQQLTIQKSLVKRINRALPQTQCGQCGHPGCLPYARSISLGEASNKCPPGGHETILELAELLNEPVRGLDPAHGEFRNFSVAVIREDECIGCTKCIQACPVDAILGGPKLMHTVIASECTGCDLCVEPCPVDCIDMINQLAPSFPQTTTPYFNSLSSPWMNS